jgi:hypothetical protein
MFREQQRRNEKERAEEEQAARPVFARRFATNWVQQQLQLLKEAQPSAPPRTRPHSERHPHDHHHSEEERRHAQVAHGAHEKQTPSHRPPPTNPELLQHARRQIDHMNKHTQPKLKCCVCLVRKTASEMRTFVPCGHRCVCINCIPNIQIAIAKECPLCRQEITQVIQVFD